MSSREEALRELKRDRPDTPFSRILAGFFEAHERVVAAVFVDAEGECVDYVSRVDPYEAKVFGAVLLQTTMDLVASCTRVDAGAALLWVLEAGRYDFVVRRISEEHIVAVVLEAGALSGRALRAMTLLAEALRIEAGLEAPAWDPIGETFEVETREAKGWGYAPRSLKRHDRELPVLDVIGRWTERGAISTTEVVCFRVRCADEELTLVHDPALSRWYRR